MSKSSGQTSRKPRFEILEDRFLLTSVWNVAAKFNDNGSADGGEAAFGDNATNPQAFPAPGTPTGYQNNNSAAGPVTASDTATSASPWSFGELDSGYKLETEVRSVRTPYSLAAAADPNSFDNYNTGLKPSDSYWDDYEDPNPDFAGDQQPGPASLYPGTAYMWGGQTESAVIYNYGDTGLNGDGTGTPVQAWGSFQPGTGSTGGYPDLPIGTTMMISALGPTDARFTAPTSGSYTFTVTLTDPDFDPFDGAAGGNYAPGGPNEQPANANDAWTWQNGQPDFLIFKTPVNSTTLDNGSSVLADGFYNDINAVNAGESPTSVGSAANNLGIIGQTYTVANGGLTINAGNETGDTGLPFNGTNYTYGSGGTWSLTNVGPIGVVPVAVDLTGDEYDMSWTVSQTVSLAAGDSIDIVTNPRYENSFVQNETDFNGDNISPTYISAEVTDDTPAAPATTLQTPPVVANSIGTTNQTNQTFAPGYPVAVDAGLTVTSTDTDITGASMTISNLSSGDLLNYTQPPGSDIVGSYDGDTGVLTLSGSATPAQYTAALQSVTFSTTNTVTGTRIIEVVADDSNSFPTYSNTAYDTVNIPILSANQASVSDTAGQTVTVDAPLTVDYGPVQSSVYGADLSGATMTIGTGYQSGDTLHFTNTANITGSYSGGVLTLTGTTTPANYQTALDSVTFSSTSASTTTRNISTLVTYSDDTIASNTATTQIDVSAPVTITGLYVSGSAWTSVYKSYLSAHSLGSSTMGYALKTGAAQLTTLPWANINTIDVQFSGPVSGITTGSLELVGGTGSGSAAAPTITAVSSLGGNAYQVSLSGPLGNNKYVLAVASTGSSFGPAVVDANGAGISGTFTTSASSFPSGNGLAGSTFDFFFNVLPGDENQNGLVNSGDTDVARSENNFRTTTTGYNPLVDYNGAGLINSNDVSIDERNTNARQTTITSPTAPSAVPVGGSGFTALALGVQESGTSSSASSAPAVANVIPAATSTTGSALPATGSSPGSGGSDSAASGNTPTSATGSRGHGRHQFAATDEAVADFDLADLRL